MGASLDLTGQRFGSWVALERHGARNRGGSVFWLCRCDCGTVRPVSAGSLRGRQSVCCGCTTGKRIVPKYHGLSRHPLYSVWRAMIQRCEYLGHEHFAYYGGRGIRVCPAWRESFVTFVADVGPRPPGSRLERVNKSGDYAPYNCRWAARGRVNP